MDVFKLICYVKKISLEVPISITDLAVGFNRDRKSYYSNLGFIQLEEALDSNVGNKSP